MRLFKKKKKNSSGGIAIGGTESGSFVELVTTKKGEGATNTQKKSTKRSQKKKKKKKQQQSSPTRSVRELNATLPLSSDDDDDDDDDEISSVDLGDIPRSISTATQSSPEDSSSNSSRSGGYVLPPPAPRTPNRQDGRNDDEDSIGSPCEAMRRMNAVERRERKCSSSNNQEKNQEGVECALTKPPPLLSTKKLAAKLSASQSSPSIHLLPEYISALTEVHSPDPSADLPSRALRALFALSEHASSHDVRVAMVRDGVLANNQKGGGVGGGGKGKKKVHKIVAAAKDDINNNNNNNNFDITIKKKAGPLIPTLLTFLQRCPRDSSEQYLTLLVLNNLSIPMENKRLVALECGAANVLGRMLLEDVGCHLLVIIIVNLTFCDVDVRKSLLLGERHDGGSGEDGEVQLIDCLAYALMVS